MRAPFLYEARNSLNSEISPATLRVQNNALREFFVRYLWEDLFSVIKWTLPKTWSESLFMWCIYVQGICCILRTNKYGVIPQPCTIGGLTVQYQPSTAFVSNAKLRNLHYELTIGIQCTVIHPNLDYCGYGDLVGYYADLLAICAESAGLNIWNSKVSYIMGAENRAVAESYKKMYGDITKGEPSVVVDEDLINKVSGTPKWFPFDAKVGSNYIADKLLADMNKIIDMFHTDIGVPNSNTDKRERLIKDEVNSNNIETRIKMDSVVDRLKLQCEETRKLFGISESEFNCRWRYESNGNDNAIDRDLQSQSRNFQ